MEFGLTFRRELASHYYARLFGVFVEQHFTLLQGPPKVNKVELNNF